jgi:uncharacterized protein (TIGR03437 family)
MKALACLLLVFAAAPAVCDDAACKAHAPCYSAETIVNAASGVAGALAPNTLASIYGTELSFVERAITAEDIQGRTLPVLLAGSGVQVVVGGLYAQMYYVSPGQVNFLVPSNLRAGEVTLQLVREGTAGPAVRIRLLDAAPGLFQANAWSVVASHADYTLVTADAPARPGGWVILWATGLGAVTPPAPYGLIPDQAAPLQRLDTFQVLLDGVPAPADHIGYAGLAPGWGGLYQVNLKIPGNTGATPEIRLVAGGSSSPPALRIPVAPD